MARPLMAVALLSLVVGCTGAGSVKKDKEPVTQATKGQLYVYDVEALVNRPGIPGGSIP